MQAIPLRFLACGCFDRLALGGPLKNLNNTPKEHFMRAPRPLREMIALQQAPFIPVASSDHYGSYLDNDIHCITFHVPYRAYFSRNSNFVNFANLVTIHEN